MNRSPFILIFFLAVSLTCTGCGSGSSDSGKLIQGTLTEAGGAGHTRRAVLRHEVGQKINSVQICALGECSVTDAEGQWGFVASESFGGGDIELTLSGHGIDASTIVNIPEDASEVVVDLQHVEGGLVEAHHIKVDGIVGHNEPSNHH